MKRRTFLGLSATAITAMLMPWVAREARATQLYYLPLTETDYRTMAESEYLGLLELPNPSANVTVGAGSTLRLNFNNTGGTLKVNTP